MTRFRETPCILYTIEEDLNTFYVKHLRVFLKLIVVFYNILI